MKYHWEETDEPRSANCCRRIHADKQIRLQIFMQIVNALDLDFKVKVSNLVLMEVHTRLSQKQRQIEKKCAIVNTLDTTLGISIGILHLLLAHFKGQGHAHFDCEYLTKGDR